MRNIKSVVPEITYGDDGTVYITVEDGYYGRSVTTIPYEKIKEIVAKAKAIKEGK